MFLGIVSVAVSSDFSIAFYYIFVTMFFFLCFSANIYTSFTFFVFCYNITNFSTIEISLPATLFTTIYTILNTIFSYFLSLLPFCYFFDDYILMLYVYVYSIYGESII